MPHISDTAVADVLQISRTRILKCLIRRGVVDVADDTVTDDLADRDPVLAALASASVYGLPPAGPARRKPTLVALCCGGRMRLVALIKDQQSIDRFLRGIGQSTDFPPLAPARGPPYFTVPGSRAAKNVAPVAPEPIDESA